MISQKSALGKYTKTRNRNSINHENHSCLYVEQRELPQSLPGTLIVGQKMLYFSKDRILRVKEEKMVKLLEFFFGLLLE